MKKEDLIDNLKSLVKRNRDAEKGYLHVAEKVEPRLGRWMEARGVERRQNAFDIETYIAKNTDEIPDVGGSLKGSLHRAWISTKAAFGADDPEDAAEECIKGEKQFVEDFNEVLSENGLPSDVRLMLTQHRNQAEQAIVQLQKLA